MRILFLSDLQLGAGAHLGRGEYGPGSRFADQVTLLARIADIATDEQADLVCVLGDVFDRSAPRPWEILAFQRFLRRLITARVLIIQGNHDVRGVGLPTALDLFEVEAHLARTPSIYPIGDNEVVIATLPWVPPASIVSELPAESRDEMFGLAAQALGAGAKILAERCEVEFPDATPILLGHWAVTGAGLPNGMSSADLHETVVPLELLTGAGFRLVALGHIHQPQVLNQDPPAFYCGSPWVNDFGEADTPHGVWLFDTAGEGLLKFLPLEDRKFVTLGIDDLLDGQQDLAGAVVRVRYEVQEHDPAAPDPVEVQKRLLTLGASRVAVQPTVVKAVRARVADADTSLSDGQALEMWMDAQDVEESERGGLRELHARFEESLR